MQRQKSSGKNHVARNGARKPPAPAAQTARGAADRLYRSAAECVRQRERYVRLVEAGAPDPEQHATLRVACLCDELLFDSAGAYERIVTAEAPNRDEDWCQKANALWHACREYERRHRNCDESSRQLSSHKLDKLRELALEYDLEASALLALKLATAAYVKTCPEAELEKRPQSFVA
jgi:hypothetical protein